jgi:hypothetical protein
VGVPIQAVVDLQEAVPIQVAEEHL